jgi:hypothetical protein
MGSFTDHLKVYWSKSEWTVSKDFSTQDELDVPTGKLLALHNKKETKCCCSYPRDRFWQEWHRHDVYLHSLLQSRILNLDVTKIGMKARYDFNRFSTNSSKFTCVHGRICIDLLSMHKLKRNICCRCFLYSEWTKWWCCAHCTTENDKMERTIYTAEPCFYLVY